LALTRVCLSAATSTAVVTIAKALRPADGKVTVFADLEAAFLHGRTDAQLGEDLNPSVTISLKSARDATVTGLVQDDEGRAIPSAAVSVIVGESGDTSPTGSFTLKTNAAVGQIVRLHAEKRGYAAADQDHPGRPRTGDRRATGRTDHATALAPFAPLRVFYPGASLVDINEHQEGSSNAHRGTRE
jgi:hypothetical protein